MQALRTIVTTRWYWLAIVILGLSMEGVALFYQYYLGDQPCQVCIHFRIWVAAFTLVGVVMCLVPRQWLARSFAHLLVTICAVGLWERSWYLYQIENGRGQGSCEFYLGFPDWFALDKWMPFMFEVRNLCSYSPELLFGISMAEGGLIVASGIVLASLFAIYVESTAAPEA